MIWGFIKNLLMFPVQWFWKYYQICREENNIWKMIFLFFISLTGVGVVLAFLYLLVCFTIDWCVVHPIGALGILGIGWLYTYVKEKMSEENFDMVSEQNALIQEKTELQMQAERNYSSMLNVMYQTIRATAPDVGGVTPTFMGEIEMPEERYRIKDGICFYTFMLEKQDIHCIYDEKILLEFRNIMQFKLHNKLQSGAFPSIKVCDYIDPYNRGYDGIDIFALEDYGAYLVIYSVFVDDKYAEYRHQQELKKTQRSAQTDDLTNSWDDV